MLDFRETQTETQMNKLRETKTDTFTRSRHLYSVEKTGEDTALSDSSGHYWVQNPSDCEIVR